MAGLSVSPLGDLNANILPGMVVHQTTFGTAFPAYLELAQADTAPHSAGTLLLTVFNPMANVASAVQAIITGRGRILLETGLTPAYGQVLYLSATVAGRATNVAPGSNVVAVGTIVNISRYAGDHSVDAFFSPGVGGSGTQGPQGAMGAAGATGSTGPQGAQGGGVAGSTATFKWSVYSSISGGINDNKQNVIVPGDTGMLATNAGLLSGSAGAAENLTCAGNYGTSTGLTIYGLSRAYSTGIFQVHISYLNVASANGTSLEFIVWGTPTPGNSANYVAMSTLTVGPINAGGGPSFALGPVSFSVPLGATGVGYCLLLTAARTDTAGTSILTPLAFTATLELNI